MGDDVRNRGKKEVVKSVDEGLDLRIGFVDGEENVSQDLTGLGRNVPGDEVCEIWEVFAYMGTNESSMVI